VAVLIWHPTLFSPTLAAHTPLYMFHHTLLQTPLNCLVKKILFKIFRVAECHFILLLKDGLQLVSCAVVGGSCFSQKAVY
jgi:hypothetical protein